PSRMFERLLREAVADARSVLDIGTSQRFAKELAPYRELLSLHGYRAAGFRPEPLGADTCDLDLDVQAIDLPDGSEDCVICLEVLEHVENPFAAARELVRIIRPGGRLLLTVPFLTSYHGKGDTPDHAGYPDFWRFTHQGLQHLFSDLEDLEIHAVTGPVEARLRFMMIDRLLDAFPARQLLDRIDRPSAGRMTNRHILIGRKKSPAAKA
ncbi:MAG TPA: methyltransferase domain-containing protein, partial [Reyranella sp.]|nr:methyltransferase domain-containing protein [Reyranella sp.]